MNRLISNEYGGIKEWINECKWINNKSELRNEYLMNE